jgi:transcriptional regulator with XRE-family HTH domain
MDAALLLTEARRRSRLSRRELARRGGTSASTLAAYESGSSVPSVVTLTRLLRAAGFDPEVSLQAVPPSDGGRRAETIEALLAFTDALPRSERGALDYPVFGRRGAPARR